MLKFDYIQRYYQASNRLKDNKRQSRSRYNWESSEYSPTTDQLIIFTLGEKPKEESRTNVDFLLETIRTNTTNAGLLTCSNDRIQILGTDLPTRKLSDNIAPDEWIKQTARLFMNDVRWRRFNLTLYEHSTHEGHLITFTQHATQFFMPEDLGIYDVQTGKKIKNRRDAIDKVYEYGFLCRRGRPITVAIPEQSGYRYDVENLLKLVSGRRSLVTKSYNQIFNKIHRTSAWPGFY